MDRDATLARLDVICGVFWLLSDGCWLMEWEWPTYIAGMISLVFAVLAFLYQERSVVTILVYAADLCWLLMNLGWEVGDLAKIDGFILAAKIVFFVSVALMTAAFWNCKVRHDVINLVMRRIRILRSLRTVR